MSHGIYHNFDSRSLARLSEPRHAFSTTWSISCKQTYYDVNQLLTLSTSRNYSRSAKLFFWHRTCYLLLLNSSRSQLSRNWRQKNKPQLFKLVVFPRYTRKLSSNQKRSIITDNYGCEVRKTSGFVGNRRRLQLFFRC